MPSQSCTATRLCNNHRRAAEQGVVKDTVIIGNGPSGITLSYFLSGNWPYYTGTSQDEFLHMRLMEEPDLSLVEQDLEFLSDGLEGRSSNPVSLLLDTLQKPSADLGLELPSLLSWRHSVEGEVEHVVLGRGMPGGIWQTLDSGLLTVSLGGWMELPNLCMADWRRSRMVEQETQQEVGRRAAVSTVASYYLDYVELMGLGQNFRENTVVTGVRQLRTGSKKEEEEIQEIQEAKEPEDLGVFTFDQEDVESLGGDVSSLCSSLTNPNGDRCRRLSSQSLESQAGCMSLSNPSLENQERLRRISGRSERGESEGCSDSYCDTYFEDQEVLPSWDPIVNPSLFCSSFKNNFSPGSFGRKPLSCSFTCPKAESCATTTCAQDSKSPLFEVTGYELRRLEDGSTHTQNFKYLANNVVLATGQSDRAHTLGVAGESLPFVLHSLPELEQYVKTGGLTPNSDPVLVVGAGLSAADAILSMQASSLPVVHVFRKAVSDPGLIFSKLPSVVYPEYHRVHSMMAGGKQEGERTVRGLGHPLPREFPSYRAMPSSQVLEIGRDRRVRVASTLTAKEEEIKVSVVVALVGASPNLSFLGDRGGKDIGRVEGEEIGRNNQVDIDVYTHQSLKVPGLFAMGPLTGDNFVRFIQGGALAIAAHKHKLKLENAEDISKS